MEHQKTWNLLNESSSSRFVTRKCDIFNDKWNANYSVRNEIIYNTEVVKSNFCDYSDVCILVNGDIIIIAHNVAQIAFNCVRFTKCIRKADGTTIDNAEDLYLVMPMYIDDVYMPMNTARIRQVVYGFVLKMKLLILMLILLMVITLNLSTRRLNLVITVTDWVNKALRDIAIAVPLKYPSNFWRSFEMPLINCKVKL